MKVITIKQPWATLITEGLKEYEFRTWKTKYRGDILIHAGKGVDKKAMEMYKHLNLEYPSGCIIAKATIKDCILIDKKMKQLLKSKDDSIYHNIVRQNDDVITYGFKLEDVEKIKPIYINGRLSLWDYNN